MSSVEVERSVERPGGGPEITTVTAYHPEQDIQIEAEHYEDANQNFSWSWRHEKELNQIGEILSGMEESPENWEFFGPGRRNIISDETAVYYSKEKYEVLTNRKSLDLIERHYKNLSGRKDALIGELLEEIEQVFEEENIL